MHHFDDQMLDSEIYFGVSVVGDHTEIIDLGISWKTKSILSIILD
jgi:hypothetical protein